MMSSKTMCMLSEENGAVGSSTRYDEPATRRRKLNIRKDGGSSYRLVECKHSIVRQPKCSVCGQQMNADHGKAFSYIEKGLRLTDDAIVLLRRNRSKKTFGEKKLHLVLDLDHTLLHSRRIQDLNTEEKYLLEFDPMGSTSMEGNLSRYGDFLVKLRPFVRDFFKEANTMFEMYIYTKGSADYARAVATLLDPERKYFGPRLISRSDSPYLKTLDLVMGEQCGIIVLDDTKGTWPNHQQNLILMERNDYFSPKRGDCDEKLISKSHSEKKTDESDTNGALANVLRVLKGIQRLFFYQKLEAKLAWRDVRLMIGRIRATVLSSCIIYFSLVDLQLEEGSHRHMAEDLGALWINDRLDSSITCGCIN